MATARAAQGIASACDPAAWVNLEENRAWRGIPMNTNPILWLQAYIIGVLVFLISVTAITEHPEWFT
jgi:hypothetical protein